MKTIFTLCLITFLFISSNSFSQGITILPSFGVQTTVSKIEGSSPAVNSFKQYMTNSTASIRAYIPNKKRHSIFIGLSSINYGISVKAYDDPQSSAFIYPSNTKKYSGQANRIEVGYQLSSKPFYINDLMGNSKPGQGMYFQLQPMVGLGYNFTKNYSNGHISSGSGTLNTQSGGWNLSLLTGGNISIGKNNKPWFFISIMRNSNFGKYYSSTGVYNSTYNGTGYSQRVHSMGSGTSFSIGIPIRLNWKKKN